MAKKKLFGNKKEPRCETCTHGKLSANGESVLCVQGGALPLTHSCRRYQYDPLRRVPKRRPLLGDYSAADFALDELPAKTDEIPQEDSACAADSDAIDRLLTYLDSHDTPDADTILAILSKPDAEAESTPETDQPQERAAVLSPDDSPDIAGDLSRLDLSSVSSLALAPLTDGEDEPDPLFLANGADEVVFFTDDRVDDDAPLSADDLVFLSDDEY